MARSPLFRSFFIGGFECSTHRLRSGRRLDLVAATRHDERAYHDYQLLQGQGIRTVREGLRWHLIERAPGQYDFSSVLPILRAARETGTQVIWDLCHYGWPDDLEFYSLAFVDRFGRLARAFTQLLIEETDDIPYIVPVNEISFFAWAAGTVGYFYPHSIDRGDEVKRQLVRAAIAGINEVWSIDRRARIFHVEPVINPVPDLANPMSERAAELESSLQFHAWDMISGRMFPDLGGKPEYLDVVGVNYYPHNQWIFSDQSWESRKPIFYGHPQYRRFRFLVEDVYRRYGRPIFVSETGNEDERRVKWLAYIGEEVRAALTMGVPIEGVCWYPIMNHPGWDDERHCYNGFWDYADHSGEREPCTPLIAELNRQTIAMQPFLPAG